MQVTIASRRGSSISFAKSKRDWIEVKKNVRFFKNLAQEAMTVTKAKPVHIIGKPNVEEKRSIPFKVTMRRNTTLN